MDQSVRLWIRVGRSAWGWEATMRDYGQFGLAYSKGSGLAELQSETLRLVTLGSVPARLAWLSVASLDLEVRRQPAMWLVALALIATGLLPYRLAANRPR